MSRPTEIQNIIEEAVAEVFDAALPRLRAEIVRRAVEVVDSLAPAPGASPTDVLNAASAAVHEAGSQSEILRHLLEGEARFAGRVALFVVKSNTIQGWQGIGFEDNDAIKNLSLSSTAGLAGRAIPARAMARGKANDFDGAFFTAVKAPAEDEAIVLPLVVKDKVAAVIYADGGIAAGGKLDASGLQALMRFAGLWLELAALRKAGGAATAEDTPQTVTSSASAATAASPASEDEGPQESQTLCQAPGGRDKAVQSGQGRRRQAAQGFVRSLEGGH